MIPRLVAFASLSPARAEWIAVLGGLAIAAAAAPVRADLRVWEDGSDDGGDPTAAAEPERFLDLIAFAQPGFIVRLDDPNHAPIDDTFWLQRARLGARAQLYPWLRMRLEIELAGTPHLQDAYLEIAPHPVVGLRVGQFLLPSLRAYAFNELNLGLLDRPLYVPNAPDRRYLRFLSPRDVGAMVYGTIGDPSPSAADPVFDYQLGAFIGRGLNAAQNVDGAFLYALRLQLHVLGVPYGVAEESDLARNVQPRIAVAASAYSNCDDRGNWNRGFAIDSELRWSGLYASAGVVWFRNSAGRSDARSVFASRDGCPGTTDELGRPLDFVSRGAHLQLQYVLPRLLFPLEGMDLELLARIDWVDAQSPYVSGDPLFGGGPNDPGYVAPASYTDPDNSPTRWRLTFGLNFFPTGEQKIRLGINYQHNREAEDVVVAEGSIRGVTNDVLWIQLTAGL